MRPQQNRRIRGRSNNNGNNRRPPNPLTRSYESNGPDVKIRGNAQHIADKYAALARDVQAAGDRVMAENYLQHAEHYTRIILSAQPQFVPPHHAESFYEEGEATNIVDLALIDANETQAALQTQDSALHLIVNREIEDASYEENEVVNRESEDERELEASVQVVEPKIERPRRMARRRLPRSITAEKEGNAPVSGSKSSTVEKQKPSSFSVHTTAVEQAESQLLQKDALEKPTRRRRSVKNASEEVVAG